MVYKTGRITERHPFKDPVDLARDIVCGAIKLSTDYASRKLLGTSDPHPDVMSLPGVIRPSSQRLGSEAVQSALVAEILTEPPLDPPTDISSRRIPIEAETQLVQQQPDFIRKEAA